MDKKPVFEAVYGEAIPPLKTYASSATSSYLIYLPKYNRESIASDAVKAALTDDGFVEINPDETLNLPLYILFYPGNFSRIVQPVASLIYKNCNCSVFDVKLHAYDIGNGAYGLKLQLHNKTTKTQRLENGAPLFELDLHRSNSKMSSPKAAYWYV